MSLGLESKLLRLTHKGQYKVLVLTRKLGEGIAIGDDVKVIVMQIKGKQVRLGIKASPTTSVHREEIYQKIQDENKQASLSTPSDLRKVSNVILNSRNSFEGMKSPLRTRVKSK